MELYEKLKSEKAIELGEIHSKVQELAISLEETKRENKELKLNATELMNRYKRKTKQLSKSIQDKEF